MRITENQSAISDEVIVSISRGLHAQILKDFGIHSNGKYSEFALELTANGGFVRPGLVSCWIEPQSQDLNIISASICHELIHYELQIDCLVNPQPSAFVNEGVAQSYAEGQYLQTLGDTYQNRWSQILDVDWENKIRKSMNDDTWFLENGQFPNGSWKLPLLEMVMVSSCYRG